MVGEIISHYKILSKLGEGGMGVVYRAEDIKLKRTVALKFLPTDALRPENKERFLREAQATASLDHPNICTIHEVDESEGRIFFAMALVEGETLSQKLRMAPLPIDEALGIAIQVAEGLEAAHEKQIVHRDIKTGNVMVTPKGRAIILDFGLAQVGERTRLTQSGATLGTAVYMSPEQVQGSNVDARSDIWSLGIVLYEMIAGRLPFDADYHLALMYSILNEEAKPATNVRPDAPPGIDAVLRRALAKHPEGRYQNARDLIADLSALRVDPRSKNLTAQRGVSPIRLIRRNWKKWLLPAAVAVLAIGLTTTVTLLLKDGSGAPAATDVASTTPGARDFYQQANRYLERYEQTENLDSAIKLFQQATTADPNFAAAQAGLAEAYRRYFERTRDQKWLTGARTAAEKALSLDDKSAPAHATLGAVLNNLSQYADAEKQLQQALAIDENSVEATRALAGAYDGLGRMDEAEATYKKAIQLARSDWTGYKTLGVFYASQRRYVEAAEQFKTVINLTPDNTIGYNNLAGTYIYMGRFSEAEKALEASLGIRESAGAYSKLGVVQYFQGRFEKAAGAFSKAIELGLNNDRGWGNNGDALRRSSNAEMQSRAAGAYRRAIELLEREIQTAPSNAVNRAFLAWYFAAAHRKQDAWAEIDQALKLDPGSDEVQFQAALVYEATGRRTDAISAYQSAIEKGYPEIFARNHPELKGVRQALAENH